MLLVEEDMSGLRGVGVVLCVMTGGQRGGGAGAVWVHRRPASGSGPSRSGAMEDRESRAAPAAALCLPALPQV